jgi:hypothetical protein
MAGGCSSSSGMVDGPIDFSVSGGFSSDRTALHLELDGTAMRTTAGGGTQTTVLDPETVADLHRKIEDAEFATLAPAYGCNQCADGFIYNVSVQLDGRVHTVLADSLAPWPDGLTAVIDTLEDIGMRPLDWQ